MSADASHSIKHNDLSPTNSDACQNSPAKKDGTRPMSRRTHQITSESLLGLRFSERLALEMITTVLWPLHTDERIGLLLTTLADNVVDVAETDEEIDALVERLRFHFKMEMHRHEKPSAKDNATDSRMRAEIRAGELLTEMEKNKRTRD